MYIVAGLTFITSYQNRRFLRISFNSSWGYLYLLLIGVLLKVGGRGMFCFIEGMGGISLSVSGIAVTHTTSRRMRSAL